MRHSANYWTWAHIPTMLIWRSLACSQLRAQHPRAQCASVVSRRPAAFTTALSIFPYRDVCGRAALACSHPATLMVFNGQQISPKVPLPLVQSSPKTCRFCASICYRQVIFEIFAFHALFWVLLRCWLGGRKSIRPVKSLSDEMLAWVIYLQQGAYNLHMVRLMTLPPRCLCFRKIQNGLSFWYHLPWFSWKKRLLNDCTFVLRYLSFQRL